jgi:hypothetical protein
MILAHRKPIDGLVCSQDQFEAIHAALARTRSGSKCVTIDREALADLLIDHANLIDRIERSTT